MFLFATISQVADTVGDSRKATSSKNPTQPDNYIPRAPRTFFRKLSQTDSHLFQHLLTYCITLVKNLVNCEFLKLLDLLIFVSHQSLVSCSMVSLPSRSIFLQFWKKKTQYTIPCSNSYTLSLTLAMSPKPQME